MNTRYGGAPGEVVNDAETFGLWNLQSAIIVGWCIAPNVKPYFTDRNIHFLIKSWPLALLFIRTCNLEVNRKGLVLNFIPGDSLCWFKFSWLCQVFPDTYCNTVIVLWLTAGQWRFLPHPLHFFSDRTFYVPKARNTRKTTWLLIQ